jgi:hypothetical protein
MVEKHNKRLQAKGKATAACPDAKSNPKRKASGGLNDQVPKKACSDASIAKLTRWPLSDA